MFKTAFVSVLRGRRLEFQSVDWIAARAFGIQLRFVVGGAGTSLWRKRDRAYLGAGVIAKLTLIKRAIGSKLNCLILVEKGQWSGLGWGAGCRTCGRAPLPWRKRKIERRVGV